MVFGDRAKNANALVLRSISVAEPMCEDAKNGNKQD